MIGGKKRTMMNTSFRKALRGVIGLITALFAMIALAPVSAMADQTPALTGTVTIDELDEGDTVNLYKIVDTHVDATTNEFKIDGFVSKWNITNPSWDTYKDMAVSDANGVADFANEIAAAVNKVTDKTTDKTATVATGATSVTINNVAAGQYLVLVTPAQDSTAKDVYQNTIISVMPKLENGNLTIDPVTAHIKKGAVSITKLVKDANKADAQYAASENTASRGGKVTYQLTTTLPKYATGSTDRTFTITDSFPEGTTGITIDWGSVKVMQGTTELTKGDNADYTVDATAGKITISNAYLLANGGQELTITYDANLADSITEGTYTNTATLTYSKDSYATGAAAVATTSGSADVTVYKHSFVKVAANDENTKLQGAEFEVYSDNAGHTKVTNVTFTSDKDGKFAVDGLGAGTYWLKEIKAPTGYQLPKDLVSFNVTGNADGETKVTNTQANLGSSLPTTGGMGTIGLTVAGLIAMIGAVMLVVRSRKRN